MCEKFLSIIQQFAQDDLSDFLHKNGHSDLEEILHKCNVINGESFLNLNELKLLKWKLPLELKRKLLLFLTEIKQNPQKFVGSVESKKPTSLNRKQSTTQTREDFKEKLKQVISPISAKNTKTPITKPENIYTPVDDCSNLDKDLVLHVDDLYDECGYLTPTGKIKEVTVNDYEPLWLDNTIQFSKQTPISERVPLTLPRNLTDDRDYVQGPQGLASFDGDQPLPMFPRVKNRNIVFPATAKTPSPASELSPKLGSPGVETSVSQTRKSPSNEIPFVKPPTESQKSIIRASPRLPKGLHNKKQQMKLKNELLNSDNTLHHTQSTEDIRQRLENLLSHTHQPRFKRRKSRSENDSKTTAEDSTVTYDTIEEPKESIFSKSYHFKFGALSSPKNLPRSKLDTSILSDSSPEGDGVDYMKYTCNLNGEPFYRDTDRKGARMLLQDLDDGAFLFRKSKNFSLTLTLKYNGKCFHLAIDKKERYRLHLDRKSGVSPEFDTLSDLVEHFTRTQITFNHKDQAVEVLLTKTLPLNKF